MRIVVPHGDRATGHRVRTVTDVSKGVAEKEQNPNRRKRRALGTTTGCRAIRALPQFQKQDMLAKAAVAKAEGKAQSVLVRAKAECEVNRMLQSTLSAILIQIKTIEKWNGDPATGHRWLHAAPRPE
jgi:hypothetical protein